jgi:hypothetical protein
MLKNDNEYFIVFTGYFEKIMAKNENSQNPKNDFEKNNFFPIFE